MRIRPTSRLLSLLVFTTVLVAEAVQGQSATDPPDLLAPTTNRLTITYPVLRPGREVNISAAGVSLIAAGLLIPVETRDVSPQGLDPNEIRWGPDSNVVGNRSTGAAVASDWSRNAALLFPWVLALATGPDGGQWHEISRRTLIYAESFALSGGVAIAAKSIIARPRPFVYLPAEDLPDDSRYDPSTERAFYAMPSGHAAVAWNGVALGMTEHLLYRPDASRFERIALGVVGGTLAASTAALRVAAGQHFPSDVLAGSVLGIASGVAVPLWHRGQQPAPSTAAWLEMTGGVFAGSLVGILVGRSF